MTDLSQYAGAGTESVTNEDLQIPFLQMLQSNSAEVDEGHPDHALKGIEGAKAGDIINTVSREVVSKNGEPLKVIPIKYEKAFVEWKPRSQGGGMIAVHGADILTQTNKNDSNKDILANGNEIVATAYYSVMYEDADNNWIKAIIAMQATQLKKSRAWLTKITSIQMDKEDGTKFQAPMFSHTYLLSSVRESNNLGSWYGWKIETGELVKDENVLSSAVNSLETSASPQLTTSEDSNPF